MAKKFSELPAGTAPQDADLLAATQSGSTVKWTIAQIKTMVDGMIGYALGLLGTASAYDVGEAAGELPDNASVDTRLGTKVDKVAGKGLSSEDLTTERKDKLEALPTNTALQSALTALAVGISDAQTNTVYGAYRP